jgi:hypothetical protein
MGAWEYFNSCHDGHSQANSKESVLVSWAVRQRSAATGMAKVHQMSTRPLWMVFTERPTHPM